MGSGSDCWKEQAEFEASCSQVEGETGANWLLMEEKTGEDWQTVLGESATQMPQLGKAGKVALRQEPEDWKTYLLHLVL